MTLIFDKIKELERIIDQRQDALFSFAFFRVGSYEVAQDIVQDVFMRFYEDMRRVSAAQNVKIYLYKTIANACTDDNRKFGKIQFVDIERLADTLIDETEKSCLAEYVRIEDLLKPLPCEQAEILRLKFVDNLNFVEIGKHRVQHCARQ
ncbi:MAG: sigma-70 family RNA polymerase sigma factor [Dysgonamonadaceae bacterium]|jgi:RNA polymerase sigma-70 factor (ECF subfamily)|nr:sigma-70 family RNA polymerase sigma factor [Dysgonamonadaceae bacterium]